jgi:hypothetical protein
MAHESVVDAIDKLARAPRPFGRLLPGWMLRKYGVSRTQAFCLKAWRARRMSTARADGQAPRHMYLNGRCA